tara:strand:- start:24206 stop:24802 length:597 start_codon:yes stop_codon:yes gene_type:complete
MQFGPDNWPKVGYHSSRFLTNYEMKLPSIHFWIAIAMAGLLSGCSTPTSSTNNNRSGGRLSANHPAVVARNAQIAAEPRGDFYYGRRFWLEGTRFWGFLREPGQTWAEAKLVMMNETVKHTPDRLPEVNPGGKAFGYDHNHEYRIRGRYTGKRVYDPNSNQVLPEFLATDFELISEYPGFLFHPDQQFEKNKVPKSPY